MSSKKRGNPQFKGSYQDNSEENLRGRLRELERQLRDEKRYSRSLEKKISIKGIETDRDVEKVVKDDDPKFVCKKCGSTNVTPSQINAPHKKIIWLICQDCNHRVKINDK